MTLLSLEKVSAGYGSSQALFDVGLEMAEGEVLALMGRNGMGKTTTVKTICRMLPASGTIRFDGQNLLKLRSHQAAKLGLGLVPEGRRCFADLTVYENLIAAARSGYWSFERVGSLFPRLAERQKQKASSLSGGEQQMLAIGRALMTNPRLLILDEATEGLAPVIRQEIWQAVSDLRTETNLSILLIDKSLKELRAVADRAAILERGKTVWSGAMNDLTDDVTKAWLGV